MAEVINSRQELDEAVDGKAVILFTAPAWCGPCQKLEPIWAELEAEGVKFLTVDVDNNPWAVQDFGIRGVPTIHYKYDGGVDGFTKVIKSRTASGILEEINA